MDKKGIASKLFKSLKEKKGNEGKVDLLSIAKKMSSKKFGKK
jgi:hypothetical protein